MEALREAGARVGGADAVESLEGADLIIDGMLGIGGKGALRGRAAELAEAAEASGAPILAVDLPTADRSQGSASGRTSR